MRLKSIKLAGFKSFVDPTKVDFPSNMTAIVGPNGCGKSNVIDAVRWVMGESSAKHLRGESMADVIFNGSTARQPVGQASIELIFDTEAFPQNSVGLGEYAKYAELSVRRKVTREGVSQYYINGAKCRRRDVMDIFLGTGMGPRSYAIIEQGTISRLIESKPEELRVFIEEAAGISKYKERRRETENRISRTQENLERLGDVREELGKQLSHLQRQAKAAERFREYKANERETQAKLASLRWQQLSDTLAADQTKDQQLATKVEQAVLKKTSCDTDIEKTRFEQQEQQERLEKAQAKFYEVNTSIATAEQSLANQRKQFNDYQARSTRLESDLRGAEHGIRRASEQLKDCLELLSGLDARMQSLSAKHAEAETGQLSAKKEWEQFETAGQEAEKELRTLSSQSDSVAADLKITERESSRLFDRQKQLLSKRAEIKASLDSFDLDVADSERKACAEVLEATKVEVENLRKGLDAQETELEKSRSNRANIQQAVSENSSVLKSLSALQEAAEKAENTSSLGKVDDRFQTDRQLFNLIGQDDHWALAIEHVLGDLLSGFVFSDISPESVEKLATSSVSASVLIPNEYSFDAAELVGTLAEKVTGAPQLVPLLSQIFLAESIVEAYERLPNLSDMQSIVLSDGTWISANWVRLFQKDEVTSGRVERASKLRSLEKELSVQKAQLNSADDLVVVQQNDIKVLKSTLVDQEAAMRSAQNKLVQLEGAYLKEQAALERAESDLLKVDQELTLVEEQISSQAVKKNALMQECEQAQAELAACIASKDVLVKDTRAAREQFESVSREVSNLKEELHQAALLSKQNETEKQSFEQIIRASENRKNRLAQDIEDLAKQSISKEGMDDLATELEGLLEVRQQYEARVSDARTLLSKVQLSFEKLEKDRASAEQAVQAARDELQELRMGVQAREIEQQRQAKIVSDLDFELAVSVASLSVDDSEASLEKSLEQLASKISRLGAINLAAVDEFDACQERKVYLDEQNQELESALETLLAAIRKIDKETRQRFKETFDSVNERLQVLFPRVFGGGRAYLEFTDQDLLSTGVMILAQPPGKKNSTIHLLSGGEKALTAIALVFAIFELNPAPFCMLDEVDAPLDDANVGRFIQLVKQMSDRVQLIFITHNKVAMEQAEHLMGVTMAEPGVSRLVSVDVEAAAALAEV